jgi:hypothetical protein
MQPQNLNKFTGGGPILEIQNSPYCQVSRRNISEAQAVLQPQKKSIFEIAYHQVQYDEKVFVGSSAYVSHCWFWKSRATLIHAVQDQLLKVILQPEFEALKSDNQHP